MLLKQHKRLIEDAQEIIENGLSVMEKPYLSLSWGKDSTLLLFLMLRMGVKIPAVYMNSGYALNTTYDYRDYILSKYSFEYIEYNKGIDYIDLCKNIGLPHERTEYEQTKAVRTLKKNKGDELAIEYGFDGNFWGLRADESKKRLHLIKSKGVVFKSKCGLYRCSPLAYFKTKDVFDIYTALDLPLNPIYNQTKFMNKELIRNSGWLSTDGAAEGHIYWLKYYYPNHFAKLQKEFPEIRGYV